MIILFHCISILIQELLQNRKWMNFFKKSDLDSLIENNELLNTDLEFEIQFTPPLYLQRYKRVYDILTEQDIRQYIHSVIDFGCGEYKMLRYFKRLNSLQKVTFVDIDEELLENKKFRLYPENADYRSKRRLPFEIEVLAGSVADPDYRTLYPSAVTAIELVEHLYPDTLEALPFSIFGQMMPSICVITTPNYEFNVLFNKTEDGEWKFRHYDHKFEWTREQFEDWYKAYNITDRFPFYEVSFYGIGEGPPGTEHLGYCTQMAVFTKNRIKNPHDLHYLEQIQCLCSNSSVPCSQAKLRCLCNCLSCLPRTSYGICTYYTYSQNIIHEQLNPSSYVYYKHITTITYPVCQTDGLSKNEYERMRGELSWLVRSIQSRYYVKERLRCEVPLKSIIKELWFGITENKFKEVLLRLGYCVEICFVNQDNKSLLCVIINGAMEEISSTSGATECKPLNEDCLSDWEEPYVKAESPKPNDKSKDMTCLGMTSKQEPAATTTDKDDDKKQQDSLFDSGYQKSLSLMDDSPQTPLEELEETDLFEDTTSTPSLTSEDNKVYLKKAPTVEKHGFVPPPPPPLPPDLNKYKLDLNRVNEMDKLHNIPPGRTFFNHFVPSPETLKKTFPHKDHKDSLPGPSSLPIKKRKKLKKSLPSDPDDESPLEDVKSITNCLIENTLNKLDVKEDKQDLIEYAEPAEEPPQDVVAIEPDEEAPLVQEEAPVVENGDLANNNRDIEGNNYIAREEAAENIGNDIVNDNLALLPLAPQVQEENANFDNNNDRNENLPLAEDHFVLIEEAGNIENAENCQAADNLLGEASREALFDPNSEQDSLEDFDIPATLHDSENVVGVVSTGNNIIFIGVHPTPEENEIGYEDQNNFPHWLLQILGTQVVVDDGAAGGAQEEPHFYCQGDGLGVHPSVIAVEIDEEEDTTESSNNSVDFAELDQGQSSQDASSLPEDPQPTLTVADIHEPQEPATSAVTEQEHAQPSSSTDEGGSGTA